MKAVVIGCGRMGAEPATRLESQVPAGWLPMSHVESLRAVEDINLVALCDKNESVLKRWGSYHGVHDLYSDYRKLIDQVRPDIVTIATRTPVKGEIIRYASRNGVRGIYVEKPIANSIEDCRRILSEVKRANVKLAYGVNRRYHSVYRHARELIRDGEIGEIVEVIVEHGQAQLLWSHPHTVDLILFLTNSTQLLTIQSHCLPSTVETQSKLKVDSDPIIENAYFKFDTGITANIIRLGGHNVKIGGTKGNLVVHANGSFIQVDRKRPQHPAYYLDRQTIHSLPDQSATVTAMTELTQSIITNSQPPISHREIELGMQMLMGCVWSHLNGSKLLHADDIPSDLVVTGKYGDVYA